MVLCSQSRFAELIDGELDLANWQISFMLHQFDSSTET
jgi:hypothetical protein